MPGQHVLDLAQVDVAVDLAGVVGGPGHVVLDERPALEHGDLGGLGPHVDAHQVAADGPALALPAPAPLERLLVELDRVLGVAAAARGAATRPRPVPGRPASGGAWWPWRNRRRPPPTRAVSRPRSPPRPSWCGAGPRRGGRAGRRRRRRPRAGRVSPILGVAGRRAPAGRPSARPPPAAPPPAGRAAGQPTAGPRRAGRGGRGAGRRRPACRPGRPGRSPPPGVDAPAGRATPDAPERRVGAVRPERRAGAGAAGAAGGRAAAAPGAPPAAGRGRRRAPGRLRRRCAGLGPGVSAGGGGGSRPRAGVRRVVGERFGHGGVPFCTRTPPGVRGARRGRQGRGPSARRSARSIWWGPAGSPAGYRPSPGAAR